MHPVLVNELTHFANERGILITMETEGSHFVETDFPIGLLSISPKFSNSVPRVGILTPLGKEVDQKFVDQHNKYRLNIPEIKKMIEFHSDYHLKPVWDGTEENLAEIEAFRVELGIPKNKTWIMPAGDTAEELTRMYPISIEMCTREGYNWTGRDHIIAYGQKRGV
jgi:7-carboxy-7-deazaguanine synthase